MLMRFVMIILTAFSVSCVKMETNRSSPIKADIQKATQCAICLEMFLENFDYNKVSNSDQHINSIKQVLTRFGRSSEEVGTINRDSVEFISQEISMHYFLDEAESQFTGKVDSDFSKCKSKMPLEDLNCDKQRLNLCDSILTYDAGTCGSNLNTPPQSSYISSPSISPPIRRGFDLTQNYPQLRNPAMQNIFSNSGPNIKTELDQIKNQYQIPQISTNMLNSFQGLNQPRFRQESYNSETSLKGPDVEGFNRVGGLSTHSDASPIGFSPSYTRQNFASAPKSHWSPPKPVLLDNFQADIGNQLKDINSLANQVSEYEKKLAEMRQELANKIGIFESSYHAIQKTITDISKLVVQTPTPRPFASQTSFSEDDWDENSKPKFLNK